MILLQTFESLDTVRITVQIVGLAFLAGVVTGVIALGYRWYVQDRIPEGLSVLLGLATIAVYLNTTTILGQVIGGGFGHLTLEIALLNIATFIAAAVASLGAVRIGDRIALELGIMYGVRELESEVSQLVRAVGRVVSVTLPEADEIEDLMGYDTVSVSTKKTIGGKTLVFPRRLTVDELKDRFINRLKEDYGIGHVGVDLAEDGTIEYLGVGSRASGIGPTLSPGTAVTAIQADPAYAATSGDIVQVWTTSDPPERVATAELRGAVDNLVTLALDEPDVEVLDPASRYRLATLPGESRPEREFASLLRTSDETMKVMTIEEGSPLIGTSIGELDVSIVAVQSSDGRIEPIPPRHQELVIKDTIYAIARPEILRHLETATKSLEATSETVQPTEP